MAPLKLSIVQQEHQQKMCWGSHKSTLELNEFEIIALFFASNVQAALHQKKN